ncbi:MAG TPA: GMC family oxidoreductase [Acidimicrobiales bacterium]|nr:GMC family oxidoreductase [Acidimicrobiales bacterium]
MTERPPVDPALLAAMLQVLVPSAGPDLLPHFEAVAAANGEAWGRSLAAGFAHLEAEAVAVLGRSFAWAEAEERHRLFRRLEAGQAGAAWTVAPERFAADLVRLANEAHYGRAGSPAWAGLGYRPGPKRDALGGGAERPLATTTLASPSVTDSYDVVVIGSGPGGATAAMVLAEAGARVLVCERGPLLGYDEIGRDHLRNHRLARYGINTPPDADMGGPRVLGDRVLAEPHQPGYSVMPAAVGGGSRVYQGMAWRLLPEDFALASRYGVPEGSSLADWPITYDDLEPFYARAEWDVGVAGDGSAHANRGPRSVGYPLPPPPWNPEAEVLAGGAAKLGLDVGPVPLLINTERHQGRGRCVQCGQCIGFACPSDAKNGTHNTVLVRAVATGNAQVATGARALRLAQRAGRVTGVELVDLSSGARRTIGAGHVVVAGGAIESARLLLVSSSDEHPDGIGNQHDQVGRHLQGHLYVGAFGLFDDPVVNCEGPGVRIATCDWIHRLPGVFGGGVVANEVTKLPILHWYWALPPDAPRWGMEGEAAMATMYGRTSHLFGPIQEIPNPEARVTLAPDVADAHGVPVARLSGRLHPDNRAQAEAMQARALEWMEASGARRVWTGRISMALTAGQHAAGTCRMGDDPTRSVTDRYGRVHGHPNLWVIDGSLHVNNGGFNPVLTIYALAYWCASELARARG